MSALKIQQFGGMLPAWDDALLPVSQSSNAQNCYLFSGALTGWRAPKLLRALTNSSACMAFRVPTLTRAQASAVLTFSAQPNPGDNVKIGENTYTFRNTLVNPYEIKIGATQAASIFNLTSAVNIGINPSVDLANTGVLFAAGTENNPVVSMIAGDNIATGTTMTVKANDFGAAFNTTVVTESTGGVRMSWNGTTFTGGLNPTFDSSLTGSGTWIEFVDPYTDVVRSPVVDDKFNRIYWASTSLPPKYNTYDRITAGLPEFLLGLNPPGCAPTVAATGGGETAQLGFPNSTSVNTSTLSANSIALLKVTPSGALDLTDVTFMPGLTLPAGGSGATWESTTGPSVGNPVVNYMGLVFADNAGAPGTLLSSTPQFAGTTAGTAVTCSFTTPPSLTAGTPYWIGIMTDGALNIALADDTGTGGYTASYTYSNGPPATAPAMTSGQPDWQMWGNANTGAVLETRAYVYTWVTAYGEESAPSPAATITGWNNATWTIGLFAPPADDMGNLRNITTKRLYRTISAVGGQTDFFLVTPTLAAGQTAPANFGDLDVNLATYTDTVLDDTIANNAILDTSTFFPPPEGLQGIANMPNGMLVGFKSNEIWFSEPYRPHAWPPDYVITTEFPIVGIGVTGSSVVACTGATPYIATGVNPSSMTLNKVLIPEPCTSRGSIVSTLSGVYYASPNGLIAVTGYGVGSNITESWITRDKWRSLTPPHGLQAIALSGCYFAFGAVDNGDNTYAQTGFTIELVDDSRSFTIWPQPGGHRIGFNKMTAPANTDIKKVMVDPWTGIGMLIQGGNINYYDFADTAPTITPYKWKSKKYQQTAKKSFEAMKIFFTVPPGSPTPGARNQSATTDPSWNTLGANQYGIIRVYADDVLVTTREFQNSGELLRVLSGFKAEIWQWEIESRVQVSNLQVATNARELGGV